MPKRRALLAASLISLASPAWAGSATVGRLPHSAGVAFALSGDIDPADRDQLVTCLSGLGMRLAEAPAYAVQFSRAVRARRVAVVEGAGDAAARPRESRPPGGSVEIASVAFLDAATGKVLFQARLSRKLRPRRPPPPPITMALCSVLEEAAALRPA